MQKKHLERPTVYTQRVEDSHFIGSRPSLTYCMWGLLQYTELRGISLDEVNGWTAHAFYLNIFESTVHIAGPSCFAGEPFLQKAMSNLGFELKVIDFSPIQSSLVEEASQSIKASIDRGIPAIVWDLFHPEFGLIYGYDDDSREYFALDKLQEKKLPYDQLFQGETEEIFVLTLLKRNIIDKQETLRTMLEIVVEHGYTNGSIDHPIGPVAQGLAAYDAWIAAFKGETIDPFYNAYNAAVYSELRKYASGFLNKLAGDSSIQGHALLAEAATHYEHVAGYLDSLTALFPFPEGGDMKNANQAVHLLEQAKTEEAQGIHSLKQLLDSLNLR